MLNYIFSILCIYVFFGFLLFLFQRRILFNVSGPPNKPIDYGLNTVKEIHIPTSDNLSLLAWYSEPKSINLQWYIFMGILIILEKDLIE